MIEISHLTKMYGPQKAVNDISFNVERSEIVGFLGPNGAGKTTTMKIITCFMAPTDGSITVGGMSVLEQSLEVRRMIGYLPEQNPLYSDMNVVDFLMYIAELRDIPKENRSGRISHMVELCGLGEVLHKDIGELSKGYRQRVGLAQAMIHDPEILILDEPTIGLDPNQVVDIRNLIKRLGREKTVVLSTHILSEVQATCNRAVIINHGEIVADSSLEELQRDIEGKHVVNLELLEGADNAMERLEKLESVEEVREAHLARTNGPTFRIVAIPGSDPRPDIFHMAVEAGWTIVGMSLEVRSLEDIFQKLTMEAN